MAISTKILKAMAAAGCSAEQIVAMIEADQSQRAERGGYDGPLLEDDGFSCVYCGTTEGPYHVDHIHPRCRGGTDDPTNKAIACARCNLTKGARLIEDWERSRDLARIRKQRQRDRDRDKRDTSRKSRVTPQTVEPPAAAQTTNGASSKDLSGERESNASLSPSLPFLDQDLGKKEQVVVARARGGGRKAALVPLPDNWHPMEHLSPEESVELEKMKDWARANAIRKADWFATWRNWKRRAPLFNGGSNGNQARIGGGQGFWEPPRGSREDLRRRNALATDDLNAYAFDGGDEPEGIGATGGEAPGWLPKSFGS